MNDNFGNLTFALYAWLGTYELTLKREPTKAIRFEDYKDNAHLVLNFESPLPDGEYLLCVKTDTPEEDVGFWYASESFEGQRVFCEDILFEGVAAHLVVYYTKTPNKRYGPLTG